MMSRVQQIPFQGSQGSRYTEPALLCAKQGAHPVNWATPASFLPIKALSGNLKGWLEVQTSHHCH